MSVRPALPRGFTLVELMVVVAIIGVLAVIGLAAWRGQITSAKSNEAYQKLQAIGSAQEAWKAQNTTYLDVSGDLATLYPMAVPGKDQWGWKADVAPDPASVPGRWHRLAVLDTSPVRFGYATVAGPPGADPMPETSNGLTFTAPSQHWYVAQAVGDLDADGLTMVATAVSWTAEIHTTNFGE